MADGYQTLADYYDPSKLMAQYIGTAEALNRMNDARYQNRLRAMQLKNLQDTQGIFNPEEYKAALPSPTPQYDIPGFEMPQRPGQAPIKPAPQLDQLQGMPGTAQNAPQMAPPTPSPEYAAQLQQQNAAKAKVDSYKKMWDLAVSSGNDEWGQRILQSAKNDSTIGRFMPSGLKLYITNKGETEGTFVYNKDALQKLADSTDDPVFADQIRNSTPNQSYERKIKDGKITEFKPAPEKTRTPEQIAHDTLKEELKREPTAKEIHDFMQADALAVKEQAFQSRILTWDKLKPNQQNLVDSIVKKIHEGKISPEDATKNLFKTFGVNMQAVFEDRYTDKYPDESLGEKQALWTADRASLQKQTIVRGMMNSFVKNLDFQVVRLKKNMDNISRVDARILNLPIREALMRVKGSAAESILTMYLTDISNDIAKLSTGSSASLAELSQSAQERWAKIHDPNLPIKELIMLVNETRQAAHGRIETADEAINETRAHLKSGGVTVAPKEEKNEGKGADHGAVIETRTGKSGRKMVKYADGTVAYAE